MQLRKKLLILSSRFPYPLEKGDKLRLYHQMRFLQKEFDLHLIALHEEDIKDSDYAIIEEICASIKTIPLKPLSRFGLGLQSLQSGLPLQVCYFYQKKIHQEILEYYRKIKPDITYVQLVRMAPYVEGMDGPKVIDIMDAMSLNMLKEKELNTGLKAMVYQRESRILKSYEQSSIQRFDFASIISTRDKDYIQQGISEQLIVIQNGVDTEYFQSKGEPSTEEIYDIGFVGNMGYQPNITAVDMLINQIIKPHFPQLKVLIAGARPSDYILSLQTENIHISGWVNDIRESYRQCKIFVAPIFSGAGQQNKILEAMSMSKPCVTTSVVNDSIHAKPGEEVLIADSVEVYVEKIKYLLNNKAKRTKIGQTGRIFVQNNYHWQNQVNELIKIFKQL